MKPWDRRTATTQLCEKFIRDYFEQNPISHLGIIVTGASSLTVRRRARLSSDHTANGVAVRMTDLGGSPQRHIARLKAETECGGEPSLQNALQVALTSLACV